MLNTGHPEQVLQFFKMSDVDPRELIVLFEDLSKDLRPALNSHIGALSGLTPLGRKYGLIGREQNDRNFNEVEKMKQAKVAILQLFHHLNQKYLSELRKDDDKMAEFMYSNYALNQNVIKKDQRKLKEIVPFVQTALIWLYIDMDDAGRDKIYDFFNQFSNGIQ